MLAVNRSFASRTGHILLRIFYIVIFSVFCPAAANAGWLYVLNDDSAGSRIYGFSVNESSGALTLLPGFPVAPGNGGINSIVSERMIADRANRRLYVINDSSDSVSAYSVNGTTGALTAMPFSPIALGTGAWNTIAVHPSGSPVVVSNNALNGAAVSFNITPTTATAVSGSPFPVTGAAGFSSAFSRDGNYLYVGGNSGPGIAGFAVNPATGVLTTLAGSPFPSGGTASLAYAVDTAGRLFAVDNAFFIRVFTSSSGVLSPVTGNPFTSGLTQRRFGLMHPNENFYVVAGNTGNNVGVFQISGSGTATTVAAVPGSPFATGATTANVLAANANGTFLYVGNRISRSVTSFAFNMSTGQLTNQIVQPSNTLGTTGAINGIAYLPDAVVSDTRADFDGDGRTDLSIVRNATWWINRSTAGVVVTQWGFNTDRLAPADFDGDGKTDIAVWRPEDFADFYVLQSATNTVRVEQFGQTGDLLTVGDWDGDGKEDLSTYRAGASPGQQSFFYFRGSLNNPAGNVTYIPWGVNGDRPVRGDFDGDGRQDIAVFRPSEGLYYIRQSSNGAVQYNLFGLALDEIVAADYDGDSKTDLAVFRPSNATWYIRNSSSGAVSYVTFGVASDVRVPGDYDGDGRDDIAVFRPSSGSWHLLNSSNNSYNVAQFGTSGDIPIPSAYYP